MRPALLCALMLPACWILPSPEETDGVAIDSDTAIETGDHSGVISGELSNFRYWHAENMPNVVHVAWDTNLPGRSWVEYGLDGALDHTTPVVENGETEHDVRLLGLKSNRTYSFKAITETDDGQTLESDVVAEAIPIQPNGIPVVAVDKYDASSLMGGADGFMLFTVLQMENSWIAIVDRDGDYVWYMEADDGLNIPSIHISPEHDGFVYTQNDRAQASDSGGIVTVDLDGNKTITRTVWGHHDAIKLPGEDTIAYINVEIQPYNMDGRGEIDIAFDNILTNPIGATDDATAELVWSFWYEYADYQEPWRTCEHFDAEAYNIDLSHDWTHSNSIMASEDGAYLYMMSKNLDALVKIDRDDGRMVWQMGGRDSEFTFADGNAFVDSPDQWSHGHMSEIPDGRFCMFDNGYHHDDTVVGEKVPHSRIIEYDYDESAMTMEKVWDYWLPDDAFNAEQGDCKALANGNHAMSVTNAGYLAEIDPAGNVLWHLQVDEAGAGTGRVTYIQDLYTLAVE